MEAEVKAKQIGGSLAVFLPAELVREEHIRPEDNLKVTVEKPVDFSWLSGRFKDIKTSTQQDLDELDEGELDEDN